MRGWLVVATFLLLIGCGGRESSLYNNSTKEITIKPYFSLTDSSYKESKGMEKTLIEDIDQAKYSIRLAIYGFSNDRIRDAILRAYKRGVDTKIVTDDKEMHKENIRILKDAGVDIVDDQDSSALMHNKFLVIDDYIVWTGSANYSYYSFFKNNENMVKITGKKVAKVYLGEFDEIYTHHYKEGAYISESLEVYFSPEDDFEQRLLELIENANYSIDFLAYAFTSIPLTQALKIKSNKGIKIRGVFDKKWNSNPYSKYSEMLSSGLNVKLDGNKQTMHDKVFIIDDKIVVTGSYNFTEKANEKNNENAIVVHNEEFASRYEDEFEEIFTLAQ
jgi:phosphatidylserine/phosphatidylglycerophosphate/cardiolipin synthase-like enzyme